MIYIIIIAIFLIAAGILAYGSFNIRSQMYLNAFCKCPTNKKIVAITYDDGPDAELTPRLLDILNKYNAKAAFFCTGRYAEAYPEVIERMHKEGHLIGNHTYNHTSLFPFSKEKDMIAELIKTNEAIRRITGEETNWFRPPFGVTNPPIARAVKALGYTTIGWSIRSYDTRKEILDKVFSHIIKRLSPGDIILLHDRITFSPELLTKLLEYLKNNNYKIVRVDEMVSH